MKWMHLFLLFTLPVFGQFSDNFSDGDFTDNPSWEGNTTKFEVFNEELHLQDALNESPAYLSTTVATKDSTIWEFYFRLDFDPSTNNQAKVYLASDVADLTGDLNGYYVKLGGVSNTVDRIQLFKQTGDNDELLVEGAESDAGISPTARVQVKRTDSGVWSLGYDLAGGTDYTFYGGDVTDIEHEIGAFMGVYCKYTSSNIDAFYFDDFSVNPTFVDDEAPELISLEVAGSNELLLTFNEALDLTTAQDVTNYNIEGIGNPDLAVLDINGNIVTLTYASNFPEETNLTLTISNLLDVAGNALNTTSTFLYNIANLHDVVITEIMANPTGAPGLPEAEYIELYNRTDDPINLKDWLFQDNSATPKIIPEYVLEAGEYIALVDENHAPLFNDIGINVLPMDFPAITNGGELLQILSSDNNLIFEVEFTDDWYQDNDKDEGGWSLEMINYNTLSLGMVNWAASNDIRGGTPSLANSILDTTTVDLAPELISVEILSNELVLTFSETLDLDAAQNVANYSVTNLGNPDLAVLDVVEGNIVTLTFTSNFPEKVNLVLTINNILDLAGNILNTTYDFFYNIANLYDVVITEIMANPTGALGLPEVEYIELYNRTDDPINLKNWLFQDNSTTPKFIPEYILGAGEYIALVDIDAAPLFDDLGINVLPMDFPAITNDGELLQILSNSNNLIFAVEFAKTWYQNSSKAEGGWSLEMINYNNPCGDMLNWAASNDNRGGTPSNVNSILDVTAADTELIELKRVGIIDTDTIELFFTESVNVELIDNQNFSIDNGIGNPIFVDTQLPDFQSVIMGLPNPLNTGIIYTLTASNVQDCVGNGLGNISSVQFALPEPIDSGDLVINELLFDQATGNVDFLEIYNRSDKIVDLQKCRVLRASSNYKEIFLDPLQITKLITEDSYLLFPGEYVCLSSDQSLVKQQYFTENPSGFIDVSGFPAYDSSFGAAIIQDSVGNELDAFIYTKQMHNDLINVTKGVSLERIDFNNVTDNLDNWHSASASVGYGTPAYENSQFFNIPDLIDDFAVEPSVFSPDGDGHEEFTTISYTMDEPGFVANIYVYDDRGREINHLVRNEVLGKEGFFKWEGNDANGDKANIGIYILFIEIFDAKGDLQRFKKTVTVAGALD